MKIDCSITENYLKEKERMTGNCGIQCCYCHIQTLCMRKDSAEYKILIEAVQSWSDDHPQKTYLEDFKEKYPNCEINVFGVPDYICPKNLGYKDRIDCNEISGGKKCVSCWNQVMEEDNA